MTTKKQSLKKPIVPQKPLRKVTFSSTFIVPQSLIDKIHCMPMSNQPSNVDSPSLQVNSKVSSGVPPPPPMPTIMTKSKPRIPARNNKPSLKKQNVDGKGKCSTSTSIPGTDESLANVLGRALDEIASRIASNSSDHDSTD